MSRWSTATIRCSAVRAIQADRPIGSMPAWTRRSSASFPPIRRAMAGCITDGERLLAIREHKDASRRGAQDRALQRLHPGFPRASVFRGADRQGRAPTNAQGEYYLTDLVGLANAAGKKVGYAVAPERDVIGVNDRAQLARAEAQFQELRRDDFMKAGVTLKDPARRLFFLRHRDRPGRDDLAERGVRAGRQDRRRRRDPRLLRHRGRGHRHWRDDRAVRPHPRRRRARADVHISAISSRSRRPRSARAPRPAT